GQGRQARAGHVELQAAQAVGRHGVQSGLQCWATERLGEDTELHQTPPVTSASRTQSPVLTERATATSARTDAMPSSMPAPCWATPFRTVSAKPSICRL